MCQKLKIVQHFFAPFARCLEHFDGFGIKKQEKLAFFVSGEKKIGKLSTKLSTLIITKHTIAVLVVKSYALVYPF